MIQTLRGIWNITHSQLISGFLVSLIREQQRFVFLLDVAAAGFEDEQLYRQYLWLLDICYSAIIRL